MRRLNLEGIVHAVVEPLPKQFRRTLCGLDLTNVHFIEAGHNCLCLRCRLRTWWDPATVTCIECIVLREE